jgi:hypothetical protein
MLFVMLKRFLKARVVYRVLKKNLFTGWIYVYKIMILSLPSLLFPTK